MSHFDEIPDPKTCPNCNKKTGLYTETVLLRKGEEYRGNGRVISRTASHPQPMEEVRITRDLYRDFKYGNFCTLRCCESFANAVWNNLKKEEIQ